MPDRFVFYMHDGAGGVLLQATLGRRMRMSVERAKSRFEPIEDWRRRVEAWTWDDGRELAIVDHCMATLLLAIDQAEAWMARHADQPRAAR